MTSMVTGRLRLMASLTSASTFLICSSRHLLGMRKIEAQPLGRDVRALLLHVIAQHDLQALVQEMRGGVQTASSPRNCPPARP